MRIAVDGPAGAGKSTLSRRLAAEYGYIYVDTGAIYRTVGLYMLRAGVGTKDEAAVGTRLPELKIEIRHESGAQRIFLNGEDVSDKIRTPEASMAASDVSAIPAVRKFLLERQRELARTEPGAVMDGRDIGTVVLPDAEIKIFLTAAPEERARRRYEEDVAKGRAADYESTLEDVKKRDFQDSNRAIAPLRPAEDSVILDTTGLSFDESYEKLSKIVQNRMEGVGNV